MHKTDRVKNKLFTGTNDLNVKSGTSATNPEVRVPEIRVYRL